MERFKSISELELAQKELYKKRINDSKVKIMVHMGTCCIAAGSASILKIMKDEVKALSLEDKIEVVSGGCIGLCYAEPTVCISHPNGTYEIYGNIDSQQGRIIVNRCMSQSPIVGVNELRPNWETITVVEGE
jgi:(2Fe-2S) ferredoxin